MSASIEQDACHPDIASLKYVSEDVRAVVRQIRSRIDRRKKRRATLRRSRRDCGIAARRSARRLWQKRNKIFEPSENL